MNWQNKSCAFLLQIFEHTQQSTQRHNRCRQLSRKNIVWSSLLFNWLPVKRHGGLLLAAKLNSIDEVLWEQKIVHKPAAVSAGWAVGVRDSEILKVVCSFFL